MQLYKIIFYYRKIKIVIEKYRLICKCNIGIQIFVLFFRELADNIMVEQLLQERCGRQLSACVRMNTRLAGVEFELNCGKKQSSRRSTEHRERGHVPGVFDRGEDVDLDLDLKYHLQTCTCSCNHMGFGNYMDYYQVSVFIRA